MKLENITKDLKIVELIPASHCVAGAYSDIIDCKNLQKVFIIISAGYGNSASDLTILLKEGATLLTCTNTATKLPLLYANTDTSTSDTLTEATAAATYVVHFDGTATNHTVVMEWDTSKFAAGYRFLGIHQTGNVGNFISAYAICVPRYSGADDLTVIS